MSDVTYYFNGHSASEWNDPANFDDGDVETFANDLSNGHLHTFNSNTCPETDLGTITKVELRVHGYGDGNDRIDLTPVFAGGDGDEHETTPVVSPGGWGSYVDITNDTNAPSPWTWSAVAVLGCKAEYDKVGGGATIYGSKVEIRVSYWIAPVSDIDVGAIPIDRNNVISATYTLIAKDNPANASGTLQNVKVYAGALAILGFRVGTFYITNGNTLKCRDSVVLGDVAADTLETFTGLSIAVEIGDYIGCYWATTGVIEASDSGMAGVWYILAEYIDPGDEVEYTLMAGWAMSLYGYGDIEVPGLENKSANIGSKMIAAGLI